MPSMKLSDIVFVPSVQHTGTWFVIDFLKNFIPRAKEMTFLLESDEMKPADANIYYRHEYVRPLDCPTIAHIHLPIIKNLESELDFFGSWFHQTWLLNLATKRSLPIQMLLLLCNFFKTVIPIRDPVAAILTREARAPQFRHFFIVDGFVALASEFARHPNVMFLPIDMTDDIPIRHTQLVRVLQHLEIDTGPHGELLNKLATEWPVSNPTPGNRFKTLYENGHTDMLKHQLGHKWAEIEYLKSMASIIMPFMESLGYTRETMYRGI